MKKKILALVCCIALLICLLPTQFAFADALIANDVLTLYEIGAGAFALAPDLGINISFTGGDGQYSEIVIGDMINTYVGEETIAQKFGEDQLRLLAGQLIIPQVLYNNLCEFWDWAKTYYDLDVNLKAVNEMVNDVTLNRMMEEPVNINGYTTINEALGGYWHTGWVSPSGQWYTTNSLNTAYYTFSGFEVRRDSLYIINRGYFNDKYTGITTTQDGKISISGIQYKKLSLSTGDSVLPTVIDPSQQWQGQIGDYTDTNLDQLLGHIYEDVEGNNLVVDGEVVPIDPPQPTPTYEPVDPDTILPEVPLGAIDEIVGNLGGTIEDALEEQTGAIESAVEGAIESQTGALEDAIEGQTGVISGAIDQAISDIDSAISEQTGSITDALEGVESAVGSVELTIEDALDVPEMRKFDLRTLFPFCIPFDIARILGSFDGVATAPHVQIPIVIPSINFSYNLNIDFSAFDPVAAILRQVELIAFAVFLAYSTSKVIRW